ncbi:MAG: hypothetical protein C0598_05260 [Marinilabiliales bacterium]|nr:MAG: hypothetical protein C0598_05260 [Marinilabiliales bacterium]
MYEQRLGIRMGYTSGITGKIIKDRRVALEGMLGFRKGGMQIYGLIERQKPLIVDGIHDFQIYFGGGAHLGYVNGIDRYRSYNSPNGVVYYEERVVGPVIGLDGIFGVEYTLLKVPITFTASFKPFFELQSFYKFKANFYDFAFVIKYTFRKLK